MLRMRVAVVAVLVAALSGCVTLAPGATDSPSLTPKPTAQLTPIPTVSAPLPATPTTEPTPLPTIEPTDAPSPTAQVTPDPDATPRPTAVDLIPYLSAEVTMVNLGDEQLTVTVTLVDPESGDEFEIGNFELQPLQVTSQSIVPTRFRLEFDYAGGSDADAGTCVIDLYDGEQIEFAATETGVVITEDAEPEDPGEMLVATSSRCAAGEAP